MGVIGLWLIVIFHGLILFLESGGSNSRRLIENRRIGKLVSLVKLTESLNFFLNVFISPFIFCKGFMFEVIIFREKTIDCQKHSVIF